MEEKIEITEKIIDKETGEVSDETKVVITPSVDAPDPLDEMTVGDMKREVSIIEARQTERTARYTAEDALDESEKQKWLTRIIDATK